jgi:hypothetical protein
VRGARVGGNAYVIAAASSDGRGSLLAAGHAHGGSGEACDPSRVLGLARWPRSIYD